MSTSSFTPPSVQETGGRDLKITIVGLVKGGMGRQHVAGVLRAAGPPGEAGVPLSQLHLSSSSGVVATCIPGGQGLLGLSPDVPLTLAPLFFIKFMIAWVPRSHPCVCGVRLILALSADISTWVSHGPPDYTQNHPPLPAFLPRACSLCY